MKYKDKVIIKRIESRIERLKRNEYSNIRFRTADMNKLIYEVRYLIKKVREVN